MGTLRRDVVRAFAGLKKLLTTPIRFGRHKHPHEMMRGVGQGPVVTGFTPYYYAPDMASRIQHAERATERWFQELVSGLLARSGSKRLYKRPTFYTRAGTELHYIHHGHRHRKPVKNRAYRRATV